nr:helix-turn-helix transcriptional regulator [Tessaracoccus sp. OS52]
MTEGDRDAAVGAFSAWILGTFTAPDDGALAANALEDLVRTDRSIVRVEQLAEHLHLSVRSVQRLAERYVGRPPLAIIRRYRLQEAAQRLREETGATVAQVAADLGYADHAHLTADFRDVLGLTPRSYRASQPPAPRA